MKTLRPDRFPRGAPLPESPSPHATRLTTARIKPVRSRKAPSHAPLPSLPPSRKSISHASDCAIPLIEQGVSYDYY